MSPGATFERVYNELKRMLAEGDLPPGSPIEPALIGKQIASSITPVRDALHRLTGERLVEAPNHNGFRVPLPTETALRDLYEWNTQIVSLAARRIRPPVKAGAKSQHDFDENVVAATGKLFMDIARAGGSAEHVRAVQQTNGRLAPFRRIEVRLLEDISEELALLAHLNTLRDGPGLVRLIGRYHDRRMRIAPQLLGMATIDS